MKIMLIIFQVLKIKSDDVPSSLQGCHMKPLCRIYGIDIILIGLTHEASCFDFIHVYIIINVELMHSLYLGLINYTL